MAKYVFEFELSGNHSAETVHDQLCRLIHEADADAGEWLEGEVINIDFPECHD